jgi:hypothetical protein
MTIRKHPYFIYFYPCMMVDFSKKKKTESNRKIDFTGIRRPMGEKVLYMGHLFSKWFWKWSRGCLTIHAQSDPFPLQILRNMFFSPECQGMSLSKKWVWGMVELSMAHITVMQRFATVQNRSVNLMKFAWFTARVTLKFSQCLKIL